MGDLCPGGGSLSSWVTVQRVSVQGYLCPEGFSVQGVSVQGFSVFVRTPRPYGKEQAVRILLQRGYGLQVNLVVCWLVVQLAHCLKGAAYIILENGLHLGLFCDHDLGSTDLVNINECGVNMTPQA